jgi:hypothetical protein
MACSTLHAFGAGEWLRGRSPPSRGNRHASALYAPERSKRFALLVTTDEFRERQLTESRRTAGVSASRIELRWQFDPEQTTRLDDAARS